MSRASALPILVVVAVYALIGPSAVIAALMAIAALLPQLFSWRARLGRVVQIILGIVLATVATALFVAMLPRPVGDITALPTPWAAFTGAMLLLCIVRRYLSEPVGGEPLSLALALAALTACGGVFSDRLYPAAVVAFVFAALVARRGADRTRAPLRALIGRRAPSLAALVLISGAVGYLGARALPLGHAWAVRQVMAQNPPTIGFSERLWLGSMRGLLSSNQAVMRVHGETDHLRGIVFNRYESGRWSRNDGRLVTIEPPSDIDSDAIDIELLESEPQHYFAPLDATDLALSSGIARIDRMGILEPIEARPARRLAFHKGAGGRARVAPPDDEDVRVPPKILRALERTAREWTRGSEGDYAKLAAIERRLQRDFTYSLEFERSRYKDPVLEFLFESKRGHCEYFASSMALIARSLGIPARVVAGYRVSERNELGGYYIVREKNAHAWVEAWTGRWQTYDPTPPGDLGRASDVTTPWLVGLFDVAGNGWSRFLGWLDRRTVLQALGTPLAVVLLGMLLRWLGARRRRARARRHASDEPLPCFRLLAEGLATRGLGRMPHETALRLASRVEASELPAQLAAIGAELLRNYAALRYGDHGDERELERRVADYLSRLRT